jgi:hypothetical protein
MKTVNNCSKENPWPGLFSYTEYDKEFFFGREEEIDKITQRILNERLTIVFGASGSGKTSLLHAGIIPALNKKNCFPIKLRFNIQNGWNINYIHDQFIQQSKDKGYEYDENSEIFISNMQNESFWEYLHRIRIYNIENNYCLTSPIIIIDQFEELFTITDKENREKWVDQLVWAINNYKPPYLKEIEEDQNWSQIVNKDIINYRFVFVIREDYIGRLDELKNRIPMVMTNRIAIKKINKKQAFDIITKPSSGLFNKIAIEKLLGFVSSDDNDDYIEPSILSLTCRELNLKRIKNNDIIIDDSYITKYGQNIIADFYEDKIAQVSINTAEFIENQLITNSGHRNLFLLDENNISHYQILKSEIDKLIKDRILHKEELLNKRWIELSHDKLTSIVCEQKKIRESIKEKKRIKSVQNDVLFAYGRLEDENSLTFSDIGEVDLGKKSLRLFSFKQERKNKNGNLTDWLSDFPNTNYFELSFKDSDGNPINSSDGIYTIRIKYNDKRLVIQVAYFNNKLEPMLHKRGNHGFKFEYDENGNVIKKVFIGIDGNPKSLKEGYAIKKCDHNKDGYPSRVKYYDENDNPISHIEGNHGYISTYDKYGNEIKREFIDADDKKMTLQYGYSAIRMEYKNNLCSSMCYFNIDDEPCIDCYFNNGIKYEYDEKKRCIKQSYIGLNNELAYCADGYAISTLIYNEKDQPVFEKYYDTNNNQVCDTSGVYGTKFIYDEYERIKIVLNLDINDNPICDYYGVSKLMLEYDNLGRTNIITSYGINGNPVINLKESLNCYGWAFEYDELGRINKLTYLNPFGYITKNMHAISIVKLELDTQNRIIKRSFFNEFEKPTRDEDDSFGEIYEYYQNNKAYVYQHDVNGEKIIDKKSDIEFNSRNQPRKITILDKYNNIIKIEDDNYSTITKEYDKYENVIEEFFFNANQEPICDNDGAFGLKYEYNIKLNVAITYLSHDGKPIIGKDGYATKRFEYDDNRHINKVLFFDINNRLTSNIDGDYGVENKYDPIGNCIYKALLGLDGNPHDNKDGISIIIFEIRNKKEVKRAYFNCTNQPICGTEGYHRYEIIANNDNTLIIKNYYDVNDNLINTTNGYSTIRQEQKKNIFIDNQIVITYLNNLGVNVENKEKHYREVYSKDGDLLFIKDKNNRIIGKDNRTFIQKYWKLFSPIFSLIFLYYLIIHTNKAFISLFKKKAIPKEQNILFIIIGEIVELEMAYILGVKAGDIIIEYNDWNYFSTDQDNIVDSFKVEFENSMKKSKTILFARKTESNYTFFKLDFPQGFMGIRIISGNLIDSEFDVLKSNYNEK